jgi:hypothetical protein
VSDTEDIPPVAAPRLCDRPFEVLAAEVRANLDVARLLGAFAP